MNKKLLVISILAVLAVFALVAISFASAVTINTQTTEKRESPLFKIRTRLAIGERIKDLTTRFIKQRLFFLPFQFFGNIDDVSLRNRLMQKITENFPECLTQQITCTMPPYTGCFCKT